MHAFRDELISQFVFASEKMFFQVHSFSFGELKLFVTRVEPACMLCYVMLCKGKISLLSGACLCEAVIYRETVGEVMLVREKDDVQAWLC